MKLTELVPGRALLSHGQIPDVDVRGIACDARDVRPGDLFVAVDESGAEMQPMIRDAVSRGAIAIVSERHVESDCGIPVLLAQDARRALAFIADRFFGGPSRRLSLVGITGTNGKSSVAQLVASAMAACGMQSESLEPRHQTCGRAPGARFAHYDDATRIHATLREMVDAGVRGCAMEVPSHALVDQRLDGVHFDCGVLTNISRDHLDFHGTFDEYVDAKAEMFRMLGTDAVAVLNRDDPAWEVMAAQTRARVVTYGISSGGDIRGEIMRLDGNGTVLRVRTPGGTESLTTRLVGRHNAANILAALAACLSIGMELRPCCEALSRMHRLAGRMERLPLRAPYAVYVDHARNEAALREVLSALRPFTLGRLIVVFACDGERDRGRRGRMARVAEACADEIIVTQGSPRSENPGSILSDIVAGFRALDHVEVEPDRRAAIRLALSQARQGDVVVIAGRGAETSIEAGDRLFPFDDRLEVLEQTLKEPAA